MRRIPGTNSLRKITGTYREKIIPDAIIAMPGRMFAKRTILVTSAVEIAATVTTSAPKR